MRLLVQFAEQIMYDIEVSLCNEEGNHLPHLSRRLLKHSWSDMKCKIMNMMINPIS